MKLLAIFCLLVLGQSDDIKNLIDKLGDDSIEIRENATKQLIDLGVIAIRPLELSINDPDAEIKTRIIHIIAQIKRNEKIKKIFVPYKRITLHGNISVKDLSSKFKDLIGLPIECYKLENKIISYNLADATISQVLDELCMQLGDYIWYYWHNSIKLEKLEKRPKWPIIYDDGIRLKIININSLLQNDFAGGVSSITISIDAIVDQSLKPKKIDLTIDTVICNNKSIHTTTVPIPQPKTAINDGLWTFSASNYLGLEIDNIQRLVGKIKCQFVLDTTTIRIGKLVSDEVQISNGYAIMVTSNYEQDYSSVISITKSGEKIDLLTYLSESSLVIKDRNGNDINKNITGDGIYCYSSDPPFNIQFEIITDVWEKDFPFEFKNIPIR